MTPLPPRPRELPIAIACLFLALLYIGIWPVVGVPRGGGGGSALWFVIFAPALFIAWLTPVAYRALGLVAYAGFSIFLGSVWAFFANDWTSPWTSAFQGFGCWLMIGAAVRYVKWLSSSIGRLGPLRIAYLRSRNRAVFLGGLIVLAVAVSAMLLQRESSEQYRVIAGWELLALAVLAWFIGGIMLFRPCFELTLEPIFWLMYAVRGGGPGRVHIPSFGPCLVVANHAAWLDPLLIEKVLTRPTTFIMISNFYNVKLLKPLLRYVFRVIVVQDKTVRREAPEIADAISALDRGECVVIFPEGYLRRKEEVPLRRFGQGIWHILRARPKTPVLACWIEGSWGSYCSFAGGPPTKNKKLDRRRPIGIGLSSPIVMSTELLQEQMQTRIFLMNHLLAARAHLGLPALPAVELPTITGTDGGEDSSAA